MTILEYLFDVGLARGIHKAKFLFIEIYIVMLAKLLYKYVSIYPMILVQEVFRIATQVWLGVILLIVSKDD